ncbi:reverse transcriptase domain-containing protein [Tanacetum coccineum]
MLRTFPFSLSGEAKTWLNELVKGTITSWNELREAFISRYFSPAKFRRLLNEIHSFHQLSNETLVDAWIRLKSLLRTCYEHGLTKEAIVQIFYHGLDDLTQEILDARGIFLYNTPNEAFKTLEEKEIMKEWMAQKIEANERIKNQVVELDNRINQGLTNRQAIIKNFERQFEYLEKSNGDVKAIEEDEIKPISTMPNPKPINSKSPNVPPFLKDSTVNIPYTNAKTFADDVLLNHVHDEEFKSIGGICWKHEKCRSLPKL